MDDDVPDDVCEIYERVAEEMQQRRYDGSPQSEPVRIVNLACDHVLVNNGGFDGFVGNGYDLGSFLAALVQLGITEAEPLIASIDTSIPGFAAMPYRELRGRIHDHQRGSVGFIALNDYYREVSPRNLPGICRMLAKHPDDVALSRDDVAILAEYLGKA